MSNELEFVEKAIRDAVENPKKAKEERDKKFGEDKGLMELIFGFVKSYNNKGEMSEKEWLKQQFSEHKVEEPDALAQEFVKDVEDYEKAKKSLETYLKLGGTREKWLGEQIEIGAAKSGKSPAEYAEEASKGYDEAMKENCEMLNAENSEEEK
jgi:hypothetical protein